jgi:tripartite-type tricarboxylate transporter receptor subunit TctC
VREAALKALADPELVKRLQAIGLDPVGSTGEETRAAITNDIPKWKKVIEDAGIKPQ